MLTLMSVVSGLLACAEIRVENLLFSHTVAYGPCAVGNGGVLTKASRQKANRQVHWFGRPVTPTLHLSGNSCGAQQFARQASQTP